MLFEQLREAQQQSERETSREANARARMEELRGEALDMQKELGDLRVKVSLSFLLALFPMYLCLSLFCVSLFSMISFPLRLS